MSSLLAPSAPAVRPPLPAPAGGAGSVDARRAYDALADHYDALTADYDHTRWLAQLEALALEHGLAGRRLLDVACGTGSSFAPMLARGYDVTACDLSPGMLRRAAARLPDPARALVADMRALPDLGPFDLVTVLDDAMNYLLTRDELADALRGLARQLRPGGILVFDVNTLRTYRTAFATQWTARVDGSELAWHGEAAADAGPGALCCARLDIRRPGRPPRTTRHVQRHWPVGVLRHALARAGLQCVAVRGQATGSVLRPHLDEARDTKAVLVGRRPPPRSPGDHDRPGRHHVLIKP